MSCRLPVAVASLMITHALLAPVGLGHTAGPPQDVHTLVAQAVLTSDGQSPGQLFARIKAIRPGTPAIVAIREMNAALGAGRLPADVSARAAAIRERQLAAQETVRSALLDSRRAVLSDLRTSPDLRSIYGVGDIGSWPGATRPDASMDVDYTIFGADPDATARVRDRCRANLLAELTGNDPTLTLADFDIVITAEGHEVAARVFETEGGIDWAKRNMRRVTIIQPDGPPREYVVGSRGDPVGELAAAERMTRLRTEATRNGDYAVLFDPATHRLRTEVFDRTGDPSVQALWDRYRALLGPAGVDYYVSRTSTATGATLDMAKHLQLEALASTDTARARFKKTLKYVERANNIIGGVPALRQAAAADPLLSDAAYTDLLSLATRIKSAPDATVDGVLLDRFGERPDAALQDLGDRARRAILRMSELAFQTEVDRIVLEVPDPAARRAALNQLTDDFRTVMETGGEYAELGRSAHETLSRLQDANDAGLIDGLREHRSSLDTLRRTEPGVIGEATDFLKQTDLGRLLLDRGGRLLDWAQTPILSDVVPGYRSSTADFLADLTADVRSRGATAVDRLGSASMWIEVLQAARTSTSNAELAMALGKTLVNNTFFGLVLNTAYAGIVQGDNTALAKAVMYMLVPETALPELLGMLGRSAVTAGAQTLFDAQMEQVYLASTFDDSGITDFGGLGLPGPSGARAYVEAMADGMPDMVAQDLVSRSRSTEAGAGVNAIALRAIAASVKGTIDSGTPLLFVSDGPLLRALDGITRTTGEIGDIARAFGSEVAISAESEADLPTGLDPGTRRAIGKLLERRNASRVEARGALADAMVRTFLERHRAEGALDSGTAVAEYEALLKMFETLDIVRAGTASLDAAGAPWTIFRNAWTTSLRERQLTAVKAVQRFSDAYSQVLRVRSWVESTATDYLGRQPDPRPLTSSLPLTGMPEVDADLARGYLTGFTDLPDTARRDLEAIKEAALDSGYDRDTLRRLFDIRLRRLHASTMMAGAERARDALWTVEVFDRQTLSSGHEAASARAKQLWTDEEALLTAFREHYAVRGDLHVALEGPTRLTAGDEARLLARVSVRGADGTNAPVPPDLARQFTFSWRTDAAPLGSGPEAERRYRLTTPGLHRFAVTVSRTVIEGGRRVTRPVGESTITVSVADAAPPTTDPPPVAPPVTVPPPTPPVPPTTAPPVTPPTAPPTAPPVRSNPPSSTPPGAPGGAPPPPPVLITNCGPSSGTFTKNPFNGLQVQYAISGICLGTSTDREGFTNSRNFEILAVTGSTVSVSGTSAPRSEAICYGPNPAYWFRTEVRLTVAGKTVTSSSPNPCTQSTTERYTLAQPAHAFSLSVPVPVGASAVDVSIAVRQTYVNASYGDRVVVVYGSGSRLPHASVPQQTTPTSTDTTTPPAPTKAPAAPTPPPTAAPDEPRTFRVTLTGPTPSAPIILGQPAAFRATITASDGKPVPAGLVYRWQPTPEVAFAPIEGASATGRATFGRPGRTRVWVEVLQRAGDALRTLAESNQVEVEVGAPTLALRIDPSEIHPGEEVRVTVVETPVASPELLTYWWDVSGKTLRGGPTADPRVYTFVAADTAPVRLVVHGRVRDGGDEIGDATVTVTPRAHEIRIDPPIRRGIPPRIWDPVAGGLREVTTAFVEGEALGLNVAIRPAPINGPLRFNWTAAPEGCTFSNAASQTPDLTCGATGTYTVSVSVRNRIDASLGTGSTSVAITVSQAQVTGAAAQAAGATREQQNRATAQRLRSEGQALQSRGQLREAVEKYRESLRYVPDAALEAYIVQVLAVADKQDAARREANAKATQTPPARTEPPVRTTPPPTAPPPARPTPPDPPPSRPDPPPPPRPTPAACTVAGDYGGRNDDGAFTMRVRADGDTLRFHFSPDDEEGEAIEFEATLDGRAFKASAKVESETLAVSGDFGADCQSMRLTVAAFGLDVTYTLTRKEP